MGKIWRAFSGLADVIQVASFGGLTLGGVVAAITAIAGYSSQLPWFWILVAAALLAWTAIFLFDRFHLFEKAMVQTPTPPAILEDVVEYVPINDVAVEVYGKARGTGLCNFIESVATRNGKLEHSSVLDVCATYIADTTVPIFGKHPPSIEWEKLDRSIFKTGRLENSSFHRYGNDDAEFTQISILASDRDTAVNQIMDLAQEIPVARTVEEQWAEHDAAFKIVSLSKDGARQELYSNQCAPSVIVLIKCDAFTGNWTQFLDPKRIFARSVMRNPYGTPQYLLVDHWRKPPWPWYSTLQRTVATAIDGDGISHQRLRLWSRTAIANVTS